MTNMIQKAQQVEVFGVPYYWDKLSNGDDIYLTQYGAAFADYLKPEMWYRNHQDQWEKQLGSGTVYRVRLSKIYDAPIDIVLKFCRVGQDIPGLDTDTLNDLNMLEFNSPFEEFARVMELRQTRFDNSAPVRTHKPLAILVPVELADPERMGRRGYKFRKKAKLANIELDIQKRYVMVYEWIKGIDAVEAAEQLNLSERALKKLTLRVERHMREKGFVDKDRKPRHIIVRTRNSKLLKTRHGEVAYGYIDFEMLQHTPEYEKKLKAFRRSDYLVRQRDRFDVTKKHSLPEHLSHVKIFGVDYIYGRVSSTGGALWVAGRDPVLFDYFLPERWRKTPRKKISNRLPTYYTLTKDNIHIVWRVSRVGERPDFEGFDRWGKRIISHGFNSPFEEFSLAFELSKKGIPSIYPRAIYQTGQQTLSSELIADDDRYSTHKSLLMPDKSPILQKKYNYISLWGHWNGPDELLAVRDGDYYSGINLSHAVRDNIISQAIFVRLRKKLKERMKRASFDDLNFLPTNFLASLDSYGKLILDNDGLPELRLSNFELIRKTPSGR